MKAPPFLMLKGKIKSHFQVTSLLAFRQLVPDVSVWTPLSRKVFMPSGIRIYIAVKPTRLVNKAYV